MPDLELTRDPADRRRYVLEGVGSLRLEGWTRRRATQAAPVGFWRRRVEATDAAGSPVATFEPHSVKRGGVLRVGARELQIAPASRWKERYALKDGDRELAVLEAKGWGKRPVRVAVHDAPVDPLLLLFAAFLTQRMAEDASAAVASTG